MQSSKIVDLSFGTAFVTLDPAQIPLEKQQIFVRVNAASSGFNGHAIPEGGLCRLLKGKPGTDFEEEFGIWFSTDRLSSERQVWSLSNQEVRPLLSSDQASFLTNSREMGISE
ncbi:hypothetical protein HYV70_03390 [Candidatus Uhrbacteria bacterium]|nr:hypothetical protein [Candidatus Uhrbacteria bacterium]